jgi:hypothetical protein
MEYQDYSCFPATCRGWVLYYQVIYNASWNKSSRYVIATISDGTFPTDERGNLVINIDMAVNPSGYVFFLWQDFLTAQQKFITRCKILRPDGTFTDRFNCGEKAGVLVMGKNGEFHILSKLTDEVHNPLFHNVWLNENSLLEADFDQIVENYAVIPSENAYGIHLIYSNSDLTVPVYSLRHADFFVKTLIFLPIVVK